MDIPEVPSERKNWTMKVLQAYGREFLIFEPEDVHVFTTPEPEYRYREEGKMRTNMHFGQKVKGRGAHRVRDHGRNRYVHLASAFPLAQY
jgi:hypothetical protein